MDEQEAKNQEDSFFKEEENKGMETAKNEGKKKAINKFISFIGKKKLFIIGIIIIAVIIVLLLLAGALYLIEHWKEDNVNSAKPQAIITSYSKDASTTETDSDGNVTSKVILKINNDGTGYELDYNNTPENLENIKDKLEKETSRLASKFTDFELAVFGALMDSGANLDYYTEEALHCFPAFIKAEACTQNLDLRPNNEKMVNGKYEPKKLKDLKETEVPGTILVQRTNTNSTAPVILEYKKKEDFDLLINDPVNNKNAINYFTINEKGNLVIAKWNFTKVAVQGNYPPNLPDDQKTTPTYSYTVSTEEIEYREYIKKYIMPFEFLIQLLVITDEPEFCMELLDHVINSKIVINIQEEETITITDETRNYTVHNKDEKLVNSFRITFPGGKRINVNNKDPLISSAKDDKGNICTNYSKNSNYRVQVHTETTSHSYKTEILEVDTWLVKYNKKYKTPTKDVKIDTNGGKYPGEYQQTSKVLINESALALQNSDSDIRAFRNRHKNNYKAQLTIPIINIVDSQNNGNNNKIISVDGAQSYEVYISNGGIEIKGGVEEFLCKEIIDQNGKGTGQYDLPYKIKVTTYEVGPTAYTQKIPSLTYTFKLNADGTDYYLDTDTSVECIVTKGEIKYYEKIDTDMTTKTTTTKYVSDPNPTTTTHIYATQSEKPGKGKKDNNTVYEKFLAVYNNYGHTRNQINSIEYWLFEMMEKNANTVELVDSVKYLLYMYDGRSRGVTDLDLTVYEPSQFHTVSSTLNLATYLRQFSHGSEAPKTADGKYYIMYGDGAGWPTIGNADLQWKSHHGRFNCSGKVLENGVEKTVSNVESYVNGKLGGSDVELSDSAISALDIYIEVELVDKIGDEVQEQYYTDTEDEVSGLDLSKQQMFALTEIYYNFGHMPVRNGYTFKQVYLAGAEQYEINSWEHNKFIWDNWWSYLGGGEPGHIPARDAAFETYVKGVFDFSNSDAGEVFSRKYYIYYTNSQLNYFSYSPHKTITRTTSNEEQIFTYEESIGGEFLQVAKEIHDYMSDPSHLYYYSLSSLNTSFEASKIPGNAGYHKVCCATYVSWVLVECGYVEYEDLASCFHNTGIMRVLGNLGWTKIENYDDLEAGDIVLMDTVGANDGQWEHVQIYAGDGCWYNAGGDWSIHQVAPYYADERSQFIFAYRHN